MTTLLAIKTSGEPEGIVLASDTQLTTYSEDDKLIEKGFGYKLIYGGFWALAYTGLLSRELTQFLGFFRGQKRYESSNEIADKTIEEVIEKQDFEKVLHLNKKLRKKGNESEDLNTFLLTINKPELQIYGIDEFGNLKPIPK